MRNHHVVLALIFTYCAGSAVEAVTLNALNETWESSPEVSLTPKDSSEGIPVDLDASGDFIHGDSGYWNINDTAGDEFGNSLNKVEVIQHEGSKALRLLSYEEYDGSTNNVWVDIDDLFSQFDSRFSGIEIPVTAGTQIKFKQQGSMAASEFRDYIRLSLIFNSAQVLHYVTQRHPDFQLPENLLGEAVLLSTSGGVYFRNVFEDYNASFGSVPGNLQINAILIENAFASATGWSIWDDIQIGSGLTPPDLSWYDGASQIQPNGWRYFDWFKGFKPEGPSWIYHGRHGWMYVIADDTSGMFLWDVAIGRWMYTNATAYPWMYAYGAGGGWVFFFEGGSPGSRYFKRGDNGQVVSEQGLSPN